MEKTYKILSRIALLLAFMFLVWLFLLSSFSSSIIIIDEVSFFIKDRFWVSWGLIILFFLLVKIIYKLNNKILDIVKSLTNRIEYKKVRNTIIIISVVEAIVFIFITRMIPTDDQGQLVSGVEALRNHNYYLWESGNYFSRWPFLNALELFIYILSKVFKNSYVIVFQVLNALALGVIYLYIDKILEKSNISEASRLFIQVAFLLFFPFRMYVTFVYGTILGFMFSILAVNKCIDYIEKEKVLDLILTGLFSMLAICAKSNYIIFMIAIMIYAVLFTIRKKNIRYLLVVFTIVLFYIVQSLTIGRLAKLTTGIEPGKGMSNLSYVAMGLHENVYRAPGWRDESHIEKFESSLRGEGNENELAMNDIAESLRAFKNKDRDVFDFFGRKISSIWANPTFQAQWINCRNDYEISTGRFAEWLLSLKTTIKILGILDVFLILIYLGNILYIAMVFSGGAWSDSSILFYTIFLGGFIFHTFWEGKAQYTLLFFMMLIPYGVCGIIMFAKAIATCDWDIIKNGYNRFTNTVNNSKKTRIVVCLYSIAFVSIAVCCYKERGIIRKLVITHQGQQAYERYKNYLTDGVKSIEEGIYYLSPSDGGNVYLEDAKAYTTKARVSYKSDGSKGIKVSIENTDDKSMIKIPEYSNAEGMVGVVAIDSLDGGMYTEVFSQPYLGLHDFEIINTGEKDTYYIKSIDGYVISRTNSGDVVMEKFTGEDNQKWIFGKD